MPNLIFQVVHISDLHLTPNQTSLTNYLNWLNTQSKRWSMRVGWLQREDYDITLDIPSYISTLASSTRTLVAITGDIGTWPGDSSSIIDGYHYPWISSLNPHATTPIIPVLGNHDWTETGHTNFIASNFGKSPYDLPLRRVVVYKNGTFAVIFFTLDCNLRMFPPWGKATQDAVDWLNDRFVEARVDYSLDSNLTQKEFEDGIKFVLVHHPPLDYFHFRNTMTRREFVFHRLKRRQKLLKICKNQIDGFLFGHMHVPLIDVQDGFLMLGCGTTSASSGSRRLASQNHLTIIRIYDDRSIDVEVHEWNGKRFVPPAANVRRYIRPSGQTQWQEN